MIFEKEKETSIKRNSSEKIIDLPALKSSPDLYFIYLEMKDGSNKLICDNFYWISAKEEVMDFSNSVSSINYKAKYYQNGNEKNIEVTLENTSDKIAFFIELNLIDESTKRSLLPVFWDDNYVSLLPHSRKIVKGSYKIKPGIGKPELIIKGWNISQINKE